MAKALGFEPRKQGSKPWRVATIWASDVMVFAPGLLTFGYVGSIPTWLSKLALKVVCALYKFTTGGGGGACHLPHVSGPVCVAK